MPLITNRRGNANRDILYYHIGVAYVSGEVYTLPEENNRLEVRNMSASTLTITVNSTQYTIEPFKSRLITDNYTQFTISANVNSSAFEVSSFVDKEDDSGSELDSLRASLNDKANQSDLNTTNNTVALKADKTYTDTQLNLKRDKSVPIGEADITPQLQQAIAGTAPIANSIPANSSVTVPTFAQDAINYNRLKGLVSPVFKLVGTVLSCSQSGDIIGGYAGYKYFNAQSIDMSDNRSLVYFDLSQTSPLTLQKITDWNAQVKDWFANPNIVVIAYRNYSNKYCTYLENNVNYESAYISKSFYIENGKVKHSYIHVIGHANGGFQGIGANTVGYDIPLNNCLVLDLSTLTFSIIDWSNSANLARNPRLRVIAFKNDTGLQLVNENSTWRNNVDIDIANLKEQAGVAGSSSYWSGKTIICFGTSITEGGAGGNYPSKLATMLNATVINKGVGSSRLTSGDLNSFCNTLAEKQGMPGWATATEAEKTKYTRSCYDQALDPYLTDETLPDLFVFEYGYNDWNVVTNSDIPANPYDKTNLIGAYNWIINRIVSKYPQAKICLLGHYTTDQSKVFSQVTTAKIITECQEKVADFWKIPLSRTWEKIGWSNNEITTTGYWDTNTKIWVNSGGASRTTTILQTWLYDGLHPHSDNSGKAIDKYSNVQYTFIRDVR